MFRAVSRFTPHFTKLTAIPLRYASQSTANEPAKTLKDKDENTENLNKNKNPEFTEPPYTTINGNPMFDDSSSVKEKTDEIKKYRR